jgi:hypothetical protein
MRPRYAIALLTVFLLGVAIGGYVFSRSLPRSFLAITECAQQCLRPSELAGLLVSAGIQRMPTALPRVEYESDKCIAIAHPSPETRIHLVLFPKRDIKNIGALSVGDAPYVLDCFAMVREISERTQIKHYRLLTNGPARQHVAYLHFHFMAK